MNDVAKPKARRPFAWVLWWIIDPDEMDRQVTRYSRLTVMQSIRGQSLLLLLTTLLTTTAIEFFTHDRMGYLDAAILLILGVFIYFGHRWAMILAMIFWTFEKLFQLYGMFQSGSAAGVVPVLIWWTVYMHAFYFAFRVEMQRRKPAAIAPEVFD